MRSQTEGICSFCLSCERRKYLSVSPSREFVCLCGLRGRKHWEKFDCYITIVNQAVLIVEESENVSAQIRTVVNF